MRNILRIMVLVLTMTIIPSSTYAVQAQSGKTDYSKQVNAIKESFENKNSEKLMPHLSSEFIVPTSKSREQTQRGLNQIFARLPFISLEIKESTQRKALIKYNFEQIGEKISSIHFNDKGEITKIELFDNLINEAVERRNAKPMPDEVLAKKYPAKKVTFTTKNNRIVYGELYEVGKKKPVILLCHQSGFNKYEYVDIAPKLNALGFNCLAVDLTSGGTFQEKVNETIENASAPISRDGMEHINAAEEEIAAAINFLDKKYKGKITLWGSSNSATLGLFAAAENKNVNAVITFSAFDHFREAKPSLSTIIPQIKKPIFMTSAKGEAPIIEKLLKDIKLRKNQVHFIPQGGGDHGSKVIWTGRPDAEEYWVAIKSFLNNIK